MVGVDLVENTLMFFSYEIRPQDRNHPHEKISDSHDQREKISPIRVSPEWFRRCFPVLARQVARQVAPRGLRQGHPRLSRLRVCGGRKWKKTTRVWWEILPGNARWYTREIRWWTHQQVVTHMEIIYRSRCLLSDQVERFEVLPV